MIKITYEQEKKSSNLDSNKNQDIYNSCWQRTNFLLSVCVLFVEVLLWWILMFLLTTFKFKFSLVKTYDLKIIFLFLCGFLLLGSLLTILGYFLKLYHQDQFSFNFSFLFGLSALYFLFNLTNWKWYFIFGIVIFMTILGLFIGTSIAFLLKRIKKVKKDL